MTPLVFTKSCSSFKLVILFIFLLFSCNDEKSNSANSRPADSLALPPTKDTIKNASDSLAADSVDQTGRFVELVITSNRLRSYVGLNGFEKLILIPYQKNANDNVRLFCYALNNPNIDAGQDNTRYRIGVSFVLSQDGTGSDPSTLPGHPITFHGLSLFKSEILALLQFPPTTGSMFQLVPMRDTHPSEGGFNNYAIWKNGRSTGKKLNPSPPGLAVIKDSTP